MDKENTAYIGRTSTGIPIYSFIGTNTGRLNREKRKPLEIKPTNPLPSGAWEALDLLNLGKTNNGGN
tara:strand:- start:3398 stop:3598 length:201 start_codon:yes stop_codon:yes gene_type:complete